MKLLRVALVLWLTTFFCSYGWDIIIPIVLFYLFCVSNLRFVVLYAFLSLIVAFHFRNIPNEPPISYVGKVTQIRENYVVVSLENQKVMVSNANSANMNDIVAFEGTYGRISSFENFSLFNYRRFRSHQHMYYQIYATNFYIVKPSHSLVSFCYRWVDQQSNDAFQKLAKRFLYQMNHSSTADSHPNEPEYVSTLISSGMHLSLFVQWFERLISFVFIETQVPWIALLLPLGYGMSFGWSLAIQRIILSRLLSMSSLSIQHRLAILMMMLLVVDPHNGFALSFVIPITLRLALLFRTLPIPTPIYRGLVMFPILLHTNFTFTVFQAFAFSWFRRLFALIHFLCILGLLIPLIQMPLVHINENMMLFLMDHQGLLSFGVTMKVSLLFCIIWLGILCWNTFPRYKQAVSLSLLLLTQIGVVYVRPWHEVTFLDVGQGDATLITLPYSKGAILIDTGGHTSMDIARMVLVPYLRMRGIRSLDLVILTHDDMDHCGAFDSLVQQIPIKEVIKHKLSDHNVYGVASKTIKGQVVQLLHQDVMYESNNDNSIITYLELSGYSFLFTGDAGVEVERALLKAYENLEADVLHVGHHGSKTSTSKAFITHINPVMAIVSSGKNNRYNHPHPDVVSLIEGQGIVMLDTQNEGSISIIVNSFIKMIRTYARRFAIIDAVIS